MAHTQMSMSENFNYISEGENIFAALTFVIFLISDQITIRMMTTMAMMLKPMTMMTI